MLYYEMLYERDRLLRLDEDFVLSFNLRERFGRFHLMLPSLIEPISFVEKNCGASPSSHLNILLIFLAIPTMLLI
ncbi:MAG: hypothetical protein ACI9XR_001626 [Flavobacterium sp.]|jgi:hypothetical protein